MQSRFAIAACAVLLTTAIASGQTRGAIVPSDRPQPKPVIPPGSYVGNQACASCHRAQFDSYSRTAHHMTSAPATQASISGRFDGVDATMKTRNPALFFQMESRSGGFYQTAVTGTPPRTTSRSARFDIVTGSGRKGKTFLSWRGNELVQLPVSYWAEPGHWINSPGYEDGTANFDRPVQPRCLECHATYFQVIGTPNRYDTTNFTLGIACEKCHGPGREHVTRHTPGPGRTVRTGGIINTGKLSRDRQMELCATCHGGPNVVLRAAPFSYQPGEPFEAYFQASHALPATSAKAEVHGNQVDLLRNSQCYRSSQMTCSTCHNVHTPQRETAAFSRQCQTCHTVQSCGVFSKSGAQIATKCVDCHMPNQTSSQVIVTTKGANLLPKFRSHWIKVYPSAPAR